MPGLGELSSRLKFWRSADRVGPDIPLTHWRLHFPSLARKLCTRRFAAFGEGSDFRPGAYAVACSKIHIGERVTIRPGSMLFAFPHGEAGAIRIEDDVLIGSCLHVYTADHEFSDPDVLIALQGHRPAADVVIRRGAWLGANVTLLAGVEIGEGAVVGAGAIVTKSVPPFAIAVGSPAKVVSSRRGATS